MRDAVGNTEVVHAPTDPDLRDYNVNFEKAHAALGFKEERSIDDGIREVLAALKSGQLDPDERSHLRQQPFVVPVSLGPRIMRADTAALAALAIWQSTLGDWN